MKIAWYVFMSRRTWDVIRTDGEQHHLMSSHSRADAAWTSAKRRAADYVKAPRYITLPDDWHKPGDPCVRACWMADNAPPYVMHIGPDEDHNELFGACICPGGGTCASCEWETRLTEAGLDYMGMVDWWLETPSCEYDERQYI